MKCTVKKLSCTVKKLFKNGNYKSCFINPKSYNIQNLRAAKQAGTAHRNQRMMEDRDDKNNDKAYDSEVLNR